MTILRFQARRETSGIRKKMKATKEEWTEEQCKNIQKGMMSGNSKEAYIISRLLPRSDSFSEPSSKTSVQTCCSQPVDWVPQWPLQWTSGIYQRYAKFNIRTHLSSFAVQAKVALYLCHKMLITFNSDTVNHWLYSSSISVPSEPRIRLFSTFSDMLKSSLFSSYDFIPTRSQHCL